MYRARIPLLVVVALLATATLAGRAPDDLTLPPADPREVPTFLPGVVALKLVAAGQPLAGTDDVVAAPTFPGAEDDPLQAELARWLTLTVPVGSEDAVLARLLARPEVAHVERVPTGVPAYVPNDPRRDEQWYLEVVGAPRAWETVRATDLRLGIIDTQFDVDHPDLADRVEDRSGRPGRAEAYTSGCDWSLPFADHGTLVAGVAVARADDGYGIGGVGFDAHAVVVQAGREVAGTCVVAGEWIRALRDLAADGVPVVSLSFASPERSQLISDAVRYATARGTLVVAAAGNLGSTAPHYPAAEPEAVAVAATLEDDSLWARSNRGGWVDIAAPGERILTTCPGRTHCVWAGTSLATPTVAASALLLAEHSGPSIRGTRLRARLLDASDRVGGHALHPEVGRGRVALDRAVTESVVRLFGADRVATAVAISGESHAVATDGGELVERVVLVPGDAPGESGWAFALPATGLLHDGRTAMLVTNRGALSPAVADELARLSAGRELDVILPGPAGTSISGELAATLAPHRVHRIAGEDAAETAAALADRIRAQSASRAVLIARGDTFADALGLAGPAAAFGHPLLFVQPDRVPPATCAWLERNPVDAIHIAGGIDAVTALVGDELLACANRGATDSSSGPTVTRDWGPSRVETAIAVAQRHFGARPPRVSIANGWKWPDAVTGGALARAHGAPILVVAGETQALPLSVGAYLAVAAPTAAYILGGPLVVADALETDLEWRT